MEKSTLFPATEVEYLGLRVCTTGVLSLTSQRYVKLHGLATKLVYLHNSCRRFIPFKLLRSFLGVAISTYAVMPCARLQCFNLFKAIAAYS